MKIAYIRPKFCAEVVLTEEEMDTLCYILSYDLTKVVGTAVPTETVSQVCKDIGLALESSRRQRDDAMSVITGKKVALYP